MGAEVGATTSLFPFDGRMAAYLRATGRDCVVDWAEAVDADLRADDVVTDEPSNYYDRVIEIDLSELEPYITDRLHRMPLLQFQNLRKKCY